MYPIRRLSLTLFAALLLAGCGGKGSPPTSTEKTLVEQLVAQVHHEQSRTDELERQLAFNEGLQRVEAAVLVLLGGALAVTLVMLRSRRKPNVP